jgi:ribosomal protein S18 acetylase RimI-like enzyme
MPDLLIRRMGVADLARAADWADAEGWNPGLDDALAFQATDPEGFLVGELDGKPVGCISVVRYGSDFGFLGFYIMTPALRGKGHGIAIWRRGMEHLSGRLVGLDGVVAQQENYKRSGFRLAWRNVRWQGSAPAASTAVPQGLDIVDARTVPLDRIATYDRRFFPAPRAGFLSLWIGLPGRTSVVTLRQGEIVGLGVLRPCRTGAKIGPLYAPDPAVAQAIVEALVARSGSAGRQIQVDVPEPNAAAVRLVEGLGLEPVFETARMYTGDAPRIEAGGLYAVSSLELG